MNRRFLLVCPLFVALLAGCDRSSPDIFETPSDGLESQMADIALETDAIADEIVSTELAAMATRGLSTEERSFSGTRSCPAGGELNVQGMILRTYDAATATLEVEASGSRARVDCAFARGDVTITVNGSAQWEASRRRVDGLPDGPQSWHHSGSWTAVSSNGEQRSCSFDYSVIRDAGTLTRTLEGDFCGRRIRRAIGWSPS